MDIKQAKQWLLYEKYNGNISATFINDCERLEAGEPLAYVIGTIPFLHTTIHLDSRPLIPRPETEYWVEKALIIIKQEAESRQDPLHILDLCAGSGAIGVAIAKDIPSASITLAEIDPLHLTTIQKNITANKLSAHNLKILQSDVFSNITGRHDFILTNPPYIDPAQEHTDASVLQYEPHLALFGGTGGMKVIESIIQQAPDFLTDSGQLWIEHEPEQEFLLHELANSFFQISSHRDQYGHIRYSTLTKLPFVKEVQ